MGSIKHRRAAKLLMAVGCVSLLGMAPGHAAEDKGDWPEVVNAAPGSPNILLIMTDDVGFGATDVFGGPVPSPTFNALARDGVRYNNFNTTALCSPSRASLLTGREPHRVNMGNVTNMPTRYDGYTSVIPKSAASMARILRDAGYATSMFGKNHVTPDWELGPNGPFDRWPTGLGFNYFYGFMSADTSQTAPNLYENTRPVTPPDRPNYLLDTDMADRAIAWIDETNAAAPDQPFFIYYAPGTAHAPHTAPADWLARFRGRFDMGWDKMRLATWQRQKLLGVIPKDAKLATRPDGIPAWNSLPSNQKLVAARMMESWAASLAYADAQIGRVIDHLKETGEYERTMIVFVQGDNGGSAEGGPSGLIFEQSAVSGHGEDPAEQLARIDDIGTGRAYTMYPAGWGWAMNAPFPWYKQVASHFGGTRNGLVITWPDHLAEGDRVRSQYAHISDIMPTVLSAAGVSAPTTVDGVTQQPIDGISLDYTFADADVPAKRSTQVYEMMENFGIYHDGWMAGSTPKRNAWDFATAASLKDPLNQNRSWELYNVAKDFSQTEDLAKQYPAKLKELQSLFWTEAKDANILPIHDYKTGGDGRPGRDATRNSFIYRGSIARLPFSAGPDMVGRSFRISADVDVPVSGAQGVLLAQGGRFGGQALYFDDGRLAFHVNAVGPHQYSFKAPERISPGRHEVAVEFKGDTAKPGAGGTVSLTIDGTTVATGHSGQTFFAWMQNTEGFDIGLDSLTPVSEDYTVAISRFTGTISKLEIMLAPN